MRDVEIYVTAERKYGFGHISRMCSLANILLNNNIKVSLNLVHSNCNKVSFGKSRLENHQNLNPKLLSMELVISKLRRSDSRVVAIVDLNKDVGPLIDSLNNKTSIIVFDDGESNVKFPEHLQIINPNPRSVQYINRIYAGQTNVKFGLEFLPIEKRYKLKSRIRSKIDNIFVYPGSGTFFEFWKVIKRIAQRHTQVNFQTLGVCSTLTSEFSNIKNLDILNPQKSLVDVVSAADYSIGACGVSLFEKTNNGLPSAIFCTK